MINAINISPNTSENKIFFSDYVNLLVSEDKNILTRLMNSLLYGSICNYASENNDALGNLSRTVDTILLSRPTTLDEALINQFNVPIIYYTSYKCDQLLLKHFELSFNSDKNSTETSYKRASVSDTGNTYTFCNTNVNAQDNLVVPITNTIFKEFGVITHPLNLLDVDFITFFNKEDKYPVLPSVKYLFIHNLSATGKLNKDETVLLSKILYNLFSAISHPVLPIQTFIAVKSNQEKNLLSKITADFYKHSFKNRDIWHCF